MKYRVNSKISVQIISVNGIDVILNATLRFNERYETIIVVHDMPRGLADISEVGILDYIIVKESEHSYISVFDADIIFPMKNEGTRTITLISTNTIIGDKPLTPEPAFQHFELKVTDGCELIGLCPYDVNENHWNMIFPTKKVDIPIKWDHISAETTLGVWAFYVEPDYQFDHETFKLGFKQKIAFKSKMPVPLKEFHSIFQKLTCFLEILCGELVTVNDLRLYDGIHNESYRNYEFIGYTDYPLKKLRLLSENSIASTAFLRQQIFKVSDFVNIGEALDSWFELTEKTSLAHSAYQRILLDEDVNIISSNGFLAAMQLVEGYASALATDQLEPDKFERRKSEIIEKIDNEDDKEFLKKYCNYSGEKFLKSLKTFTFKSISVLNAQSFSQFQVKYDKLLLEIKEMRDVFTHSSACDASRFDNIKLNDIAVMYKYFYRINVLSHLGIPPELICKRLSYSRNLKLRIKSKFDIDIKNLDNKLSEFDRKMWQFSRK